MLFSHCVLAHRESNRLKRRVSFDVPDLAEPTTKSGAAPLPPTRLLLAPHSKSSLNLSWDHSSSHNRNQPCTYIVEVRDPRNYSWSTYVSGLPETSVQLRNLNLNHIYAIRVRAENIFGVSDPSQPVTSRLLTRSKNQEKKFNPVENFLFLDDERRPEDQAEPISKYKRPPTSSYEDFGGKRNDVMMMIHRSLISI